MDRYLKRNVSTKTLFPRLPSSESGGQIRRIGLRLSLSESRILLRLHNLKGFQVALVTKKGEEARKGGFIYLEQTREKTELGLCPLIMASSRGILSSWEVGPMIIPREIY